MRVILVVLPNAAALRVDFILVSQTRRMLKTSPVCRLPMFRLIRHIHKIESSIVWIVAQEQLIHQKPYTRMLVYVITS